MSAHVGIEYINFNCFIAARGYEESQPQNIVDHKNMNINNETINLSDRNFNLEIKRQIDELKHNISFLSKLLVSNRNIHNSGLEYKKKENEKVVFEAPTLRREEVPELIVLMSSLGRGGSSWIGALLASTNDKVMYVFEPLKEADKLYKSSITQSLSDEVMSQVLSCMFSDKLMKLQESYDVFLQFPDECSPPNDCTSLQAIRRRCRMASTIVVKVSQRYEWKNKVTIDKLNWGCGREPRVRFTKILL